MKFRIQILLITCGVITMPALFAESSINETRQMDMEGLVQVENLAGTIDITVWDKAEVSITGDLGEDVNQLEIIESSSGIRISVENRRQSRNIDETHLHLRIPVSASVEAEGVSADISVDGLESASLVMTSVSGDVTAYVEVQRLEVETVSGDVTFRGSSPRSDVETVSGEIELEGIEGEIRVSTVSGDMNLTAKRIDRGRFETVSGQLEIYLDLEEGARLNAESLSGDVRLYLPSDQQAEYTAQTYSGKIRSDFGSVKNKSRGAGSSLSHREGSNGATVRLESFSGDIRISGN
jgi:DUF4097 and DUF4098 domain-containing protein YvlB